MIGLQDGVLRTSLSHTYKLQYGAHKAEINFPQLIFMLSQFVVHIYENNATDRNV